MMIRILFKLKCVNTSADPLVSFARAGRINPKPPDSEWIHLVTVPLNRRDAPCDDAGVHILA